MEIWNVEAMTGYKPMTTFWNDFEIAEHFGINAIKDTYNRCVEHCKDDYKYLTELVMVLNHKCWRWYQHNDNYSELYSELYYELDEWALDNLKGDELTYYLRTLD